MVHEHTLKAFDVDIDGMRSAVMTMGGLVEKQFTRSIDAVRHADLSLVSQVLIDERTVNQLHLQSDLLCNQILARRQPFAVDLREVIAAIHTVNDLERIGDEAKKIAFKARHLDAYSQRGRLPLERVHQMAEVVRDMLGKSLDSFLRHDTRRANELAAQDASVDAIRDELLQELLVTMSSDPGSVTAGMDMVFVVQSIERVGDHAKNIAEYVVHVVDGVDMRHAVRDPAPGTDKATR